MALVLALGLLPACGSEEDPQTQETPLAVDTIMVETPEGEIAEVDTSQVEAAAEERVHVEAFKYALMPGGARVLTGRLYNPTPTPVRNAQIQVSLLDANNRRISSMTIHVRDVQPGTYKAFREAVDSELDVQRARVRSIMVI